MTSEGGLRPGWRSEMTSKGVPLRPNQGTALLGQMIARLAGGLVAHRAGADVVLAGVVN